MITDLLIGKSHEDIIRDLCKLSKHKLNKMLIDDCRYCNIFAIKYLIDAGANVNYKDKYGWTPLILASYWNIKDVVELLKKHGAK